MIDYLKEFELIRPYNNSEVSDAIHRLISYPEFEGVLSFLYPDKSLESVKMDLLKIKTTDQFQVHFMYRAASVILNSTSSGLSVSGTENLDPDINYLFISNHRDIVLDAAILQSVLVDNDRKTSQITFGSNLMSSPAIIDFGKLNKMFKFYRDGSRSEMYKYSLVHSAYIRDVIVNQKESVWIAQRNGRTKDGNDSTQPALLKMLIGCNSAPMKALKELNIIPVAISYEYEPCDLMKTRELYISANQQYIKKKNEDLQSILSGILSPKGHIHLSIGQSLNNFIDDLGEDVDKLTEGLPNRVNKCSERPEQMSNKEKVDLVAAEMDSQIHNSYHLYPNNYIAFDMLSTEPEFEQYYTKEQYAGFDKYITEKLKRFDGDTELLKVSQGVPENNLRRTFIQIYASPVANQISV